RATRAGSGGMTPPWASTGASRPWDLARGPSSRRGTRRCPRWRAAHPSLSSPFAPGNVSSVSDVSPRRTTPVAGAGGFIGSAGARRLRARGWGRVVSVGALACGGDVSRLERAGGERGHRCGPLDVRDGDAVLELLRVGRPRTVLRLAAD